MTTQANKPKLPPLYGVWLPAMFWQDHAERDLDSGTLIRRSGRRVFVRCTPHELAEILSDAEFYADQNGPSDFDGAAALRRSAAATVRSIRAILSPSSEK